MTNDVERIVDALRVICSEYECCECPSDAWCHNKGQCLDWDAADLIESLSAELEQVKRERDAAVKDLKEFSYYPCLTCKHRTGAHYCEKFGERTPGRDVNDVIFCGQYEWRGVKEGERETDRCRCAASHISP